MGLAGDRPPRYEKKRYPHTVGRGPVPRHAAIAEETSEGPRATEPETIAGETLSDARVASEGPRATVAGTGTLTLLQQSRPGGLSY